MSYLCTRAAAPCRSIPSHRCSRTARCVCRTCSWPSGRSSRCLLRTARSSATGLPGCSCPSGGLRVGNKHRGAQVAAGSDFTNWRSDALSCHIKRALLMAVLKALAGSAGYAVETGYRLSARRAFHGPVKCLRSRNKKTFTTEMHKKM